MSGDISGWLEVTNTAMYYLNNLSRTELYCMTKWEIEDMLAYTVERKKEESKKNK